VSDIKSLDEGLTRKADLGNYYYHLQDADPDVFIEPYLQQFRSPTAGHRQMILLRKVCTDVGGHLVKSDHFQASKI